MLTVHEETPALIISESAASKVGELIVAEGNPKLKLRIYVTGGGCSGFQYGFAFEETEGEDDTLVEKDGVTFLVDSTSLQYLTGAQIDYQEGLEGARFIIHNPNAAASCSCGNSFSV